MRIVVLENTTRGLGDFNFYIREHSGKEVWVFTDTDDLFDNCSKGHKYIFIIDMLTPGADAIFLNKIKTKYSDSTIIGLANNSNKDQLEGELSEFFSKVIVKNPSMGGQVINFLTESEKNYNL